MCYILNIETATTVCSVSISKNGQVLALKELDNGFTHAENLHLFISDLLTGTELEASQLHAIAVSKGPGSYTGLRIGVSAAKGMAYALNIPLISVDTLQIMSNMAHNLMPGDAFYAAMIDARRMEVYTSVYDHSLNQVIPTEALIVDEDSIKKFGAYPRIYFFGDGMSKCQALLSSLPTAAFLEDVKPSARYMGDLSFKKFESNTFEDVAYFEPFYLKDFLIKQKS